MCCSNECSLNDSILHRKENSPIEEKILPSEDKKIHSINNLFDFSFEKEKSLKNHIGLNEYFALKKRTNLNSKDKVKKIKKRKNHSKQKVSLKFKNFN